MTPIYDENILSDLHKDAYGFRPRELFWNEWNRMNTLERNTRWTRMCNDLERENIESAERDAAALRKFLSELRAVMRAGAQSWREAIDWLVQAENNYFDMSQNAIRKDRNDG
jgi:hypothetical protein